MLIHLFLQVKKYFTKKNKNYNEYKSSDFISIDIDDSILSLEQITDLLQDFPFQIGYNTYSNGKNGLNRFRLLYFFDTTITSKEDYELLAKSIISYIDKLTSLFTVYNVKVDESTLRCTQMMFATNDKDSVIVNNRENWDKEDLKNNLVINNNLFKEVIKEEIQEIQNTPHPVTNYIQEREHIDKRGGKQDNFIITTNINYDNQLNESTIITDDYCYSKDGYTVIQAKLPFHKVKEGKKKKVFIIIYK